MANKIRLGIIGLGAQGSMYARFIMTGMVPNMEIGTICDHDQARAEIVQSEFPDVKFYSDYVTREHWTAPPDRTRIGRHPRCKAGQRHPPLELDRRRGSAGLRRGRVPGRTQQADPRRGHVCREMISVPRGWHDRRTSGTTRVRWRHSGNRANHARTISHPCDVAPRAGAVRSPGVVSTTTVCECPSTP
jgi:hypothetical protein